MANPSDRLLGWVFDVAQRRFARNDAAGAERMGERLGLLAYKLDKKHRFRAEENLKLAFPERGAAWAAETAKDSFRHFGRLAGDLMRSPNRSDAEVLASLDVPPQALEYLNEADGRGTLICTGHHGNWERAAHWVTASGHKLSVVVRHVNQPGLQERVEGLRKTAGIDVLSRGDAAMGMMRKLRRGEMVAVLPDQNASDAFVPFFGHQTGTVIGPAVLAQRTNAFILPAFCLRTGPGRYRIVVGEPIDLEKTPMDPVETMAAYYRALEAAIREAPEQYLWMHDRWKSSRRRGKL
jgi:KDO2-lipid IV(A) lauroyltransferase